LTGYLARHAAAIFAPIIDYLRQAGDIRSCKEIEHHFAQHFGIGGVTTACEYLADSIDVTFPLGMLVAITGASGSAKSTLVSDEYKPGRFSFNVKGGRCEECQGEGVITTQLYFMPDVDVTCGVCKGARFNSETLEVTVRGKTIDDVLNMSIEEGVLFFSGDAPVQRKLEVQSATTLSGGEAQRVKIASELSTLQRSKHTMYILDEPTTGLHLADVEKLLESLNKLVEAGHTVVLIEHHVHVIKTADHVIDLGPEGGHAGGEVVVTGTPEDVARRFLKPHLRV
jgi:excinuclease ABC subunit A